ncbi:unnamed protein product, partial [Amoebophrya sp. A25]
PQEEEQARTTRRSAAPSTSEEQKLHFFKMAEALEDTGEFLREPLVERRDDFLDDEFDLQQMQNGLSTIVGKIPEYSKMEDHLINAQKAQEAETRERPTPEQALLNCIQKVYSKNLKSKTQIAMQKFVIDFLAPKKPVGSGSFTERRADVRAQEVEAEHRFWKMYHVNVRKADSFHERVIVKKWPKWRTRMKELAKDYRPAAHTHTESGREREEKLLYLRGMKSVR